jgi:hypothetical protein
MPNPEFPNPEFINAIRRLVAKIEAALPKLDQPVKMVVAGGAAVHYYTAYRVTADVDAVFSKRLLLPDDLEVVWKGEDGKPRLLYLDKQYNDTFALMHEDYVNDAIPCAELNAGKRKIHVYFLNPVDLAVSKLSRYEAVDQEDIRALAARGLVSAVAVRARAEEALGAYVGERSRIKTSIKLACKMIDEVQHKHGKNKAG